MCSPGRWEGRAVPLRRGFVGLFVATATAQVGLSIIAPILPLYVESFSATAFQIGLVFTAFSFARAVSGPFVGRLSDRVGRKPLIIWGLAGCAVASMLFPFTTSLWQIAALRLFQGAASMLVTPSAQAYVGDLTPIGREGRYMNAFSASQFIGMAIGPLLGGGIGGAWSYQAAFLVMAGLSALSLLLVWLTVPTDHAPKRPTPISPSARPTLRRIVSNDAIKAMLVYLMTRGFWRQSFNTFYPLLAVSLHGASETRIGIVLSVYMFAEGLLQVPFGFLADKFSRVRQIAAGSLLAPLMLFAVPYVSTVWGIVLVTFLMGGFSALGRASVAAIRTEIGRTHGMATVAGIHSSAFSAGRIVGPIVTGAVVDAAGLLAAFPLGGTVGLAGTFLVVGWMRRWLRRDPAAPGIANPRQPAPDPPLTDARSSQVSK